MRVCRRCGQAFGNDRCSACGYSEWVETPDAEPEPTEPSQPVESTGWPTWVKKALLRAGVGAVLLATPWLLDRFAALVVRAVPSTASGCGPICLTALATVAAAVAMVVRVPCAIAAGVVLLWALAACLRRSEPDDVAPDTNEEKG